jgi:N-acetylglucosaminyl-diphospho-decaprenol L-rhamnosyltransferase
MSIGTIIAPMQAGTVTLSLVSHRQALLCAHLLADLAALTTSPIAKLIFTVNIPEPLPALDKLPFPVEIVRNPRPLGFAANHNQAFARTTSEYFAVLNPDLRLARDPFPVLIEHLADPKVGLVAPLVLEPDGQVADFARRLVSPWEVIRRRIEAADPGYVFGRPDWLAGMFLVLRSQTFADLGGFDTRYTLYCEDVDLCARIRLRGLRLEVVREASVTHLAQRASRRSLRPMFLHASSLLKFWFSPVYRNYQHLLRKETTGPGEI